MTSGSISRIGAAAAVVMLLAGCGGGHDRAPRAEVTVIRPDTTLAAAPSARSDTTGGAASARSDTTLAAAPSSPAGGTAPRLPEPVLKSANLIMGYRVQIFTSASLVDAEILRDRLRRDGVPAYVEYRSPLYRVRLGDCMDLAEARALRERALLMGYDRATIVQTLVQAGAGSRSATRVF